MTPEAAEMLEEWVRAHPSRSIRITDNVLCMRVTAMEEDALRHHERFIDARAQGLHFEVEAAIGALPADVGRWKPTCDTHYDWLYMWPSHRVERSHTCMLHMLENDRPWTRRYIDEQ